MALCVALQADGTLAPTGQAMADCSGYVLGSPVDVWLTDLVAQALAVPSAEVLAGCWFATFALVMTCYVASRQIGTLVSFVR